MGRLLADMSLEELWQLFPIILTGHQDCWKEWYDEEEQFLSSRLPSPCKIHHIGSTSIDSIWAKPI
ncbi:MAG: GrpB family protein, partial [Bacteroidales bacterium]|nr:GrpB family protein [Bacteroidales bacterium]